MEVPSRTLSDPVDTMNVGMLSVRVVRKEVVLADRIVGFKYWGVTDDGLQAIAMLTAFGSELDAPLLESYLRRESAEDAYMALRRLGERGTPLTHEQLQIELEQLRTGT